MVRSYFVNESLDGQSYWFSEPGAPPEVKNPTIHLLPNYDEHLVAYKNHTPSLDLRIRENLAPEEPALMAHIIVLNGLVIGGWRRELRKKQAIIQTRLLVELEKDERAALMEAAEDYGRFLGVEVKVV